MVRTSRAAPASRKCKPDTGHLRQKLAAALATLGWSQTALAQVLGVTKASAGRYVRLDSHGSWPWPSDPVHDRLLHVIAAAEKQSHVDFLIRLGRALPQTGAAPTALILAPRHGPWVQEMQDVREILELQSCQPRISLPTSLLDLADSAIGRHEGLVTSKSSGDILTLYKKSFIEQRWHLARARAIAIARGSTQDLAGALPFFQQAIDVVDPKNITEAALRRPDLFAIARSSLGIGKITLNVDDPAGELLVREASDDVVHRLTVVNDLSAVVLRYPNNWRKLQARILHFVQGRGVKAADLLSWATVDRELGPHLDHIDQWLKNVAIKQKGESP